MGVSTGRNGRMVRQWENGTKAQNRKTKNLRLKKGGNKEK